MNRNQITAAARAQLAWACFTRPAVDTRPAVRRHPRGRHAGTHRIGGWSASSRRPAGRHARHRQPSAHRAVVFARRLAISLAAVAMVAIGLATMVEA
jgi:hypothetical protein